MWAHNSFSENSSEAPSRNYPEWKSFESSISLLPPLCLSFYNPRAETETTAHNPLPTSSWHLPRHKITKLSLKQDNPHNWSSSPIVSCAKRVEWRWRSLMCLATTDIQTTTGCERVPLAKQWGEYLQECCGVLEITDGRLSQWMEKVVNFGNISRMFIKEKGSIHVRSVWDISLKFGWFEDASFIPLFTVYVSKCNE